MSDIIQASMRALAACLLTVNTLLYSLIWLSHWFEFDVSIWLLWAVLTIPSVAAAFSILIWATWGRSHRTGRATVAGRTR